MKKPSMTVTPKPSRLDCLALEICDLVEILAGSGTPYPERSTARSSFESLIGKVAAFRQAFEVRDLPPCFCGGLPALEMDERSMQRVSCWCGYASQWASTRDSAAASWLDLIRAFEVQESKVDVEMAVGGEAYNPLSEASAPEGEA